MAIMWNGSLLPWIDPNGAPYSGAQAFFFNAGTTTPRTVYRDSGLGLAHDHPVVANASGMFPAIFLPAGDYRLRVEDQDGVTLWDVDGISTPIFTDGGGGGGGDTPVELLARTGDLKDKWGKSAESGWVRANGRTIGAAASGATERANADCEALFVFLWAQDTTLAVSGGRGASSASDWAAAKTIALPDLRLRARIGLASMGNSASGLIPPGQVDGGETLDTLGATLGTAVHTLTQAQMPVHNHSGSTSTDGAHTHSAPIQGSPSTAAGGFSERYTSAGATGSAGSHNHSLNINNAGGDSSHPNTQPSSLVTIYIKL